MTSSVAGPGSRLLSIRDDVLAGSEGPSAPDSGLDHSGVARTCPVDRHSDLRALRLTEMDKDCRVSARIFPRGLEKFLANEFLIQKVCEPRLPTGPQNANSLKKMEPLLLDPLDQSRVLPMPL